MMIALALTSAATAGPAFAQGADGKAVYDENCKKCHGVIHITLSSYYQNYNVGWFSALISWQPSLLRYGAEYAVREPEAGSRKPEDTPIPPASMLPAFGSFPL